MFRNIAPIVLASGSPRRQHYLREMGLTFTVQTASVHEQPLAGEDPKKFVLRMAEEKAAKVTATFPHSWVISGDTVVCLGQRILGKPRGEEEAVELLMALAGREHLVKTGFSVVNKVQGINILQVVTTRVMFAGFAEPVARAYVATGEPLDKAGAYGIQGKGGLLVESIKGSYSNVVGFPLFEIMQILQEKKVIEPVSANYCEEKICPLD